jgi:ubiquitin-protein ligase
MMATKAAYQILTTASIRSMLEGDMMDLEHDLTPDFARGRIQGLINGFRDVRVPAGYAMLLYLPGGMPWLQGTLREWQDVNGSINRFRLYVVLARPLPRSACNPIEEVCDASPANKLFLSPLYETPQAGLAEMAALMGYFQHNGPRTEHMLLALAKATCFAPLIVNMFRFLENEQVTGENLVAICGPIHTLFASLLPGTVRPNLVLTYTLKCASFLSRVTDVEFLKLYASTWSDDIKDTDYLEIYARRTGQQEHFVVWTSDTTDAPFTGYALRSPPFPEIEAVFDATPVFKPLSPKTVHYLFSVALMRSRSGPCVFLGEVPNQAQVARYLDPVGSPGRPVEREIEVIATEVGDRSVDPALDILEGGRFDQAIMVCFDASTSMANKLDGFRTRGNLRASRCEIAKKFLAAFRDRSYAYRLASAYGLIRFGDDVKVECPLSFSADDFEAAIGRIVAKGATHLWDALDIACNNLAGYRANHPNARLRILVISDGEDSTNPLPGPALITKLLRERVAVDGVMVSTADENAGLCVTSQMTGGQAFRATSEEHGLGLFEAESFLDINIRELRDPYVGTVTAAVLEQKFREFDPVRGYAERSVNIAAQEALQAFPLATPLYGVRKVMQAPNSALTQKSARILRELKILATRPDPDIAVYVNVDSIEKLRATFQGPRGSPFEGKFWSIYITFPRQYPVRPPRIIFANVPYHPNISAEGRAIFGLIEYFYSVDRTLKAIIQRVRAVLGDPETRVIRPVRPSVGEEFDSANANYVRNARDSANRFGAASERAFAFIPAVIKTEADLPAVAGEDMPLLVSQFTATNRHGPIEIDAEMQFD